MHFQNNPHNESLLIMCHYTKVLDIKIVDYCSPHCIFYTHESIVLQLEGLYLSISVTYFFFHSFPYDNHPFVLCIYNSVSASFFSLVLDSTFMWSHTVFAFPFRLVSHSIIPLGPAIVVANSEISLFQEWISRVTFHCSVCVFFGWSLLKGIRLLSYLCHCMLQHIYVAMNTGVHVSSFFFWWLLGYMSSIFLILKGIFICFL